MVYTFNVPSENDENEITLDQGSSAIFVGANGSGKTRLAVWLENFFGENAHRISAHRSLNLNPNVPKTSERNARNQLQTGVAGDHHIRNRISNRWGGSAATHMLSDFAPLVQLLFANQANSALATHQLVKKGEAVRYSPTKFDVLSEIWHCLLPTRILEIGGDSITVRPIGADANYNASEMSDGERAIFYMIGQVLVASSNQLIIIDEPELHVHPSIMGKLWDELEAARPDCAFIYITHDLEFAAARSAQKFVIKSFLPTPGWQLEPVPDDTGFSEELTTLILGSRRPILFVEGTETSLDLAIYRACYPDWTVVPRSSCTEVIHSVVTMRRNASLTRVTCTGVVDGDDYGPDDKTRLEELGIKVLSVSEIENIFLLPEITNAIATHEGHDAAGIREISNNVAESVFATLDTDAAIEKVVVRYCKRRVDRALKKLDISFAENLAELGAAYNQAVGEIDIVNIATERTTEIRTALGDRNLTKLLEYYDNKGMLGIAARHIRNQPKKSFEEWLLRSIRNGSCPGLRGAVSRVLPELIAI